MRYLRLGNSNFFYYSVKNAIVYMNKNIVSLSTHRRSCRKIKLINIILMDRSFLQSLFKILLVNFLSYLVIVINIAFVFRRTHQLMRKECIFLSNNFFKTSCHQPLKKRSIYGGADTPFRTTPSSENKQTGRRRKIKSWPEEYLGIESRNTYKGFSSGYPE